VVEKEVAKKEAVEKEA
jgi:hypothetical protein